MAIDASIDVTIVIYAHDAEAELEPCVEAALAQEGASFEVVIVDDVSSDKTPIIANHLAVAHDPVSFASRIIEADEVGAALDGLRAAHGRFALLLDATDRLRPNVLASLVAAADANGADICCPSVALASPGEHGRLERVPRLERPLATSFEAGAIVDAIFEAKAVPPTIRGRLFATRLLRHTLAEVADERIGEGKDEVLSFISACFAQRLVGCPEIVSADLACPEEPTMLTPELATRLADARKGVAQVVRFLDHQGAWDAYERGWEHFVVALIKPCLAMYPRQTSPEHWKEVGDLLLGSWGPSVISEVAEESPAADQALVALALQAAPTLARHAERPAHAVVVVSAGAPGDVVREVVEALSRRTPTVTLIAEEDATLDAGVQVAARLPKGLSRLGRSRVLEHYLEEQNADCAVFFSTSVEAAWDELSARSLGLATALVMTSPLAALPDDPLALDIPPLIFEAAAVALAHVCATREDASANGALWQLLGARTTSIEGLTAQLTLASSPTIDGNGRLLAARLLETARTSDEALVTEHAQRLRLEEENDALRLVVAARDKAIEQSQGSAEGAAQVSAPTPQKRPWRRLRHR